MDKKDLLALKPANPYQAHLQKLALRPSVIPLTGRWGDQPIEAALTATFSDQALAAFDEKAMTDGERLLDQARNGATEAVTSVNALRIDSGTNFLVPELRIIPSFFDVVRLGDAEEPYFQNETLNEVSVRIVSEDGRKGYTQRVVRPQTETSIDLLDLATDTVTYRLRDKYKGSGLAASALATIDLSRDLAAQLDAKGKTFLDTLFGSFTLNGARQDRVYVPHSYIDASNLPTSNDITLDATYLNSIGITRSSRVTNTTSTGLRQEVFEAITAYSMAWGEVRPSGMAVNPSGIILVPSSDVVSIANSLTLDGAKGSDIAEQLKAEGFASLTWLGRSYTLVPCATLPKGVALVPFQSKIGKLYLKPSMDWEETKTYVKENREERSRGLTYGLFAPVQHRPFALRIRYRTAS